MGDRAVRLTPRWSGIGVRARGEQFQVSIDGTVMGSIANNETVEVAVEPGHRTSRLGSGRHRGV